MNKIGKEYISEIKTLFPIKSKKEKAYLKNLAIDVNSYCEEAGIISKQELYDNYGKPMEVVNAYFSTADVEYVVKRVKIAKYIKIGIAAILALALVATSSYCIQKYIGIQIMKEQQIYSVEEVIEEY